MCPRANEHAMSKVPYNEFELIFENAEEFGIALSSPPDVERISVAVDGERRLSGLQWHGDRPSIVFLHGGGQNAHTWDTVGLALSRPMLAFDLPGHGHSDNPGSGGAVNPHTNAVDIAAAMRLAAATPSVVIGMSLGGLTTIALTGVAPELVRAAVIVDVTPGVDSAKSAAIANFVNGPATFPDFDAILARTVEHNATRTVAALRRGILHNAMQLDDGSWVWRYRRPGGGGLSVGETGDGPREFPGFGSLWDVLGNVKVPLLFVRGMRSQSVVDDADEVELLRRLPSAKVVHMDAGHSIQGDLPLELAAELGAFIDEVDRA